MPNPIVAEIKDRLNIADVISSYIPVKKAGTNYKANCPFHQEKSASLMISPSKQIWHCFGCNEGGNVFSFVMKYENLEFGEALKILAERAGVQLPKYSKEAVQADQYKERLIKINDLAANFYAQVLQKSSVGKIAREYLDRRGLNSQTIKDWQIGFAPDEFHILENVLVKKSFSKQELVDAGVSSKSQRGGIYDRFFNRITFPIKSYSGDIVGFTARVVETPALSEKNPVKGAKYVNSPQTEIYNKSRIIFGLYQAKQAIRKEDCAVIVEGNMDVISCHQAGFKNVIASSGTALTYEQLQILSRLTKRLKFAFDADLAGDTATRRALDLALRLGFSVYIIKIEGAKDPDELIKKDPKLFSRAVKEAPLYLDYFFDKEFANYNPSSIDSKKKIFSALLPLIEQLSDPLEKDHYVKKLSQKTYVYEKTILESMAPSGFKPAKLEEGGGKAEKPIVKNRFYVMEQHILGYALFDDQHFNAVKSVVAADDFQDQNISKIYESLLLVRSKNGLFSVEKFIDSLNNEKGSELQGVAQEALFVVESEYSDSEEQSYFQSDFKQILNEFKTFSIKSKMAAIVSNLAIAENNKNKSEVLSLNKEFLELSKALKSYEK